MTPPRSPRPSAWRLRWDLLWGRLLLGLTQAEHRGELRPEVHRFLADRYARLADDRRAHGWTARADRLAARARDHAQRAGGDDLPPACAMGLPRPRPRLAVAARGTVPQGRWPGNSSR